MHVTWSGRLFFQQDDGHPKDHRHREQERPERGVQAGETQGLAENTTTNSQEVGSWIHETNDRSHAFERRDWVKHSGELDGRDYFYIDEARFEAMVREGGFVEWVEVYGHRYGTGRDWLDRVLASGQDVLLDIETTGALNLRRAIPDAHMIFILPPSAAALEERLRSRGKDSDGQIRIRLEYARHEMELYPAYDYLVMNDDLELAYRRFESIFLATRATRERMAPAAQRILEGF